MFLENKPKNLENNTNYIQNLEYIDRRNKLDKIYEHEMKKSSNFFLILKNLEQYKAQFEILQKIKKTLHIIKKLIKNFLIFIKAYFQKILTCPRMKLCNF